ncbi:MAG: RluA family pseudouridine synthase [Bacillota bacterium]
MTDRNMSISRWGPQESVMNLIVRDDGLNERLDTYVAKQVPGSLSRSKVQTLIGEGRVTLNGAVVRKPSVKVKTNDVIEVRIPPPRTLNVEAQDIPLDIIYEDNSVLVINKPRGMVVHPGAGHREGTLVNAILGYCPEIAGVGGEMRPGIVHRLDKDTTGLLVVAKNEPALRFLQAQMKARKVKREYLALCRGSLRQDSGTINAPIGRHPVDRKRMAVLKPKHGVMLRGRAREAVTEWKVVTRFGCAYTLVIARLHTGRTHQIRVHMSYIGHPVAGDLVYGRTGRELGLLGQALHAFRLGLFLGESYNEFQEFTAPLPKDFSRVLLSLNNEYEEELPSWLMV